MKSSFPKKQTQAVNSELPLAAKQVWEQLNPNQQAAVHEKLIQICQVIARCQTKTEKRIGDES